MALAPSFLMTLDCRRVLVVAGEHLVHARSIDGCRYSLLAGGARRVPTAHAAHSRIEPLEAHDAPGRNVASSMDDSNDPVETARPGEIFPCAGGAGPRARP